jgi:hypothetical protein
MRRLQFERAEWAEEDALISIRLMASRICSSRPSRRRATKVGG